MINIFRQNYGLILINQRKDDDIFGQPHCMVADAGCEKAGDKTQVESV